MQIRLRIKKPDRYNELRIDAAEDDKSKGRDKVPPHLSELN